MNEQRASPTAFIAWSHVALNCRDISTTEEFYTKWFGFTRSRVFENSGSTTIFLKLGDACLELFGGDSVSAATPQAPHADGPQTAGSVRHLAFRVNDLDAFLHEMGDAATVTLGPIDFNDFIPGWRSVWLADPDGIVVEVSQGYREPLSQQ
ncbi:MAG: VOC family protein [Segniliparus sp.]|uniref:VOC family protein n=1 Tax=Segniliparus sp. TaxID=2804064 RepID=UPI003F366AB4